MLIQNYFYDNPQALALWKNEIDSVRDMILCFSNLFGRYPFWKEKYGHCMAPMGGGMEHQTMTTIDGFSVPLGSHELAHQWFGDHVTCATWEDIWLNEGFATYGAYLFFEKFHTAQEATDYMTGYYNSALQDTTGTVYVAPNAPLFDPILAYHKACSVIHMLRFVVNDDTKFFDMLKNYQQVYAFSNATTEQFKNTAALFLQQNLDTFMNQWIYGAGYPIYSATWNQVADTVIVNLHQSVTTTASVPLFYTPIELTFTSPQGDTVVRVDNSQAMQSYSFIWKKSMNNMSIDPNNQLLNLDQGVAKDPTLTQHTELFKNNISVYPNPTTHSWIISNLTEESTLIVYDMNGRVVYQTKNRSSQAIISAQYFPAGVYQLSIENAKSTTSIKLIKQ